MRTIILNFRHNVNDQGGGGIKKIIAVIPGKYR
jgi:hypothetical protein